MLPGQCRFDTLRRRGAVCARGLPAWHAVAQFTSFKECQVYKQNLLDEDPKTGVNLNYGIA